MQSFIEKASTLVLPGPETLVDVYGTSMMSSSIAHKIYDTRKVLAKRHLICLVLFLAISFTVGYFSVVGRVDVRMAKELDEGRKANSKETFALLDNVLKVVGNRSTDGHEPVKRGLLALYNATGTEDVLPVMGDILSDMFMDLAHRTSNGTVNTFWVDMAVMMKNYTNDHVLSPEESKEASAVINEKLGFSDIEAWQRNGAVLDSVAGIVNKTIVERLRNADRNNSKQLNAFVRDLLTTPFAAYMEEKIGRTAVCSLSLLVPFGPVLYLQSLFLGGLVSEYYDLNMRDSEYHSFVEVIIDNLTGGGWDHLPMLFLLVLAFYSLEYYDYAFGLTVTAVEWGTNNFIRDSAKHVAAEAILTFLQNRQWAVTMALWAFGLNFFCSAYDIAGEYVRHASLELSDGSKIAWVRSQIMDKYFHAMERPFALALLAVVLLCFWFFYLKSERFTCMSDDYFKSKGLAWGADCIHSERLKKNGPFNTHLYYAASFASYWLKFLFPCLALVEGIIGKAEGGVLSLLFGAAEIVSPASMYGMQ